MATKNIIPRNNDEGQIGSNSKKWASAHISDGTFDTLTVGGVNVTGGGGSSTLTGLSDTAISSPASGHILVHDGSDSFDNVLLSGDATLAANGDLTISDNAITTAKITDSNVTLAKIENITSMRVLGNTTGSTAGISQVTVLDEDDMNSNSDTSLASQQSIKAYVDSAVSGGGSGDKIEEGNSSVEVTDTGTNGTITFKTENSNRWEITSAGHLLPIDDSDYDIGSADKKVRHLFLSDNSLKFVDSSDNPKSLSRSGNDLQWVGETLTTKSYVDSAISGLAILESVEYLFQSALFATNFTQSVSSGVDIFTQNSAGTSSMSYLLQSSSASSSDYHLDNGGDLNGIRVLILGGVSSGIDQRYAGVYEITSGNATGSSSGTPYVFTRASDFTTAQRANGKYVFVKSGYWADSAFVCSTNSGNDNSVITATSSFGWTTGAAYKIISVSNTDFTVYGASSNTVGVIFVYNGSSKYGSGTAQRIDDYIGADNDITFTRFSSPAGVEDDSNLKIVNNKYAVSLDGGNGKTIYEDTRINSDLNAFNNITSILLASSSSSSSPYYNPSNRITPVNAFLNSKKAIESISLKQFPVLNLDYTTNTEVESGFVLNVKPSANVYLGSSSTNTLTRTGSYFQITGDVTSNFSTNDLLVFIDRSELGERNTGIFEVHDVSEVSGNTRITFKNSSNAPTAAVASFVKQNIYTGYGTSDVGSKLFKAKICIVKTDKTTDKLQYAFGDSASSLTFSTISTGSGSSYSSSIKDNAATSGWYTPGTSGSSQTINDNGTNNEVYYILTPTANNAIVLPDPSNSGQKINIKNMSSSHTIVISPGSNKIDGDTNNTHSLSNQYENITFVADGNTNWYRV